MRIRDQVQTSSPREQGILCSVLQLEGLCSSLLAASMPTFHESAVDFGFSILQDFYVEVMGARVTENPDFVPVGLASCSPLCQHFQ